MLPIDMWNLLLKHGIYVIAAGDPGQLPPIDKDSDNHVLDKPHIFLDEIMRQAQDSEIIRLSMWIREGKPISNFPCSNKQVMILKPNEVVTGAYLWADQIICSTNNKRIEINNIVRKLNNFSQLPQNGDKIISLHNHWDYMSKNGEWALTNGSIGTIQNFSLKEIWLPRYIKTGSPVTYMMTNISLDDGDTFVQIPIDYNDLVSGQPSLTPRQIYQINNNSHTPDAPFSFTYAYAITGWKAQGSEWNKVLMFEEDFPHNKEEHKKALYTGITRAQDKLVVVTK